MKIKTLSIFVALLFVALISNAQQFNFGVKLGGNSTSLTVTGNDIPGYASTSKLKLHFGGIAHYQIYKGFGIQLELMYSAKGDAFSYDYLDNPNLIDPKIDIEQKLTYLSAPLMFKYILGNPRNGFHIDAGFTFNTLLSHKQSMSTLTYTDQNDPNVRVVEDYDLGLNPFTTDNGLIFGLGLISNGIVFDFHFELGQNAIYETNPKLVNRTFMISAGYLF